MVNPKQRNAKGQFVRSTKKAAAKKAAKPAHSAKKKHTAKKKPVAKKAAHIVIDMGGRQGLVKAKKGVYNVNPKRNAKGKFVKKTSTRKADAKHVSTRKKHHRRNPKGQFMLAMKGAILPAAIFPASALAGDLIYGVMPLPASMRTGFMKPVGKLGVAAILGSAAAFFLPARYASLIAGGLVGGVVYDLGKQYLQTTFPTLPLAGAYDYPEVEYEQMHGLNEAPAFLGNAAPNFLGDAQFGPGMGEFTRRDSVSAYVDNE